MLPVRHEEDRAAAGLARHRVSEEGALGGQNAAGAGAPRQLVRAQKDGVLVRAGAQRGGRGAAAARGGGGSEISWISERILWRISEDHGVQVHGEAGRAAGVHPAAIVPESVAAKEPMRREELNVVAYAGVLEWWNWVLGAKS